MSIPDQLRPWLSFKLLEFLDQGYESIHIQDFYRFLVDYHWRKQKDLDLFEQIYQIQILDINAYFDFEAIEAQTNRDLTLDQMDLSDFF